MKTRFLWLSLFVIGALVAVWFVTRPKPKPAAKPFVPITEGATIDFSSGKPVVKNSAEEKAIIDAAVKEMNDAVKNLRLDPIVPPAVVPDPKAEKTVKK